MRTRLLPRRGILAMTAAILVHIAFPPRAIADNPVIAPIDQLVEGLLRVMKAGEKHAIRAALR
jgi:hypothetical protein